MGESKYKQATDDYNHSLYFALQTLESLKSFNPARINKSSYEEHLFLYCLKTYRSQALHEFVKKLTYVEQLYIEAGGRTLVNNKQVRKKMEQVQPLIEGFLNQL